MPSIHTAHLAACRAGDRLRLADGGTAISADWVGALTCFQKEGLPNSADSPKNQPQKAVTCPMIPAGIWHQNPQDRRAHRCIGSKDLAGVQVGDLAPDFTLDLDDGTRFSPREQRGRPVVLFFYPEDDSGGCTNENQEFSERKTAFEALGARIAGISPDTVQSHIKFRRKYNLQIQLVSDPERVAIEAFGLWQMKKLYGREFMGLIRTSFIIDQEGRIAKIMRATRILGHAQKVLEALQQDLAGRR